jgi:membrane associated rhomboid family serine protease
MAINVVLFAVELARPSVLYDLGMIGVPALTPAGTVSGVSGGEWYRLLTSAFIAPGTGTIGVLDIGLNMWVLYVIGPQLERLLGPARYLGVYLLSAVGGSIMYYYLQPYGLAAGASGAIYGLFGAWFVVARRLRLDARGIVILIVINLVFSFSFSKIAWQAHIGGLITGALITAAYAYAPRKNRAAYQIAATAALVVIMVVAVVIKNGQLRP